MREASTLHDKMLDRNWLLKQKRKRISSALEESPRKEGSSMLSEFTKKSTSLRKKFKGEPDASRHSKRTKGHDGYYFECEQCDLGGSLLCCDNCPRTYHLECLSPPLKHAPAGKWQCPKCCNEKVDKPLSSAETSSRRARRTTIKKSMAVHSTSSEKASHSGRSLLGSRKSTCKEKAPFLHKTTTVETNTSHADISSNIKSSPSSENVLRAGISAAALSKKKKKAISPPQKKITAQKASFVKSLNSDPCDRLRKGKRDLHRSQSKKSNIPLILSSQISKKNRKKINKIDRESSKLINRENVLNFFNHTCGEASPCPESCVSLPKCRSSEHLTFMTNMKQETHLLKSSKLKKSEISSLGASFLSHGLNDGEYADKKMTYQEEFLHDGQQVDRILGCRVRNDLSLISETTRIATSHTENKAEIGRPETEFLSCDFTGQENHSQVDDCFHGSKVIDTKLESSMNKGFHVTSNLIDYKFGGDYSNELNKDVKSKTCGTMENMDKAAEMFSSVSQSSQDHSMFGKGFEPGDNSAGGADVEELTAKKGLEESIHVGFPFLENHSRHHMPRPSDLPVTCESQDAHAAATIEPKSDHSSEILVPNKSVQEFSSKDADLVTYDFFVKWVGKSNIHNSWISEDQLKVLGKRKLENYKAKYGIDIINICEEQWCHPQRIVSLHELENGGGEVLVKWCGLPYDECTWERLNEPVVQNFAHLISELKQFECQTLEKDTSDDFAKKSTQEVVPLVEQPKELKGGLLFPHQLEALNWLRKCWHKSKNVILADEMGLGKTVSACSFISSLYFEFKVKLPCLVLVPLSTMPNWLAEFASWAPHLNVVEYHGCAKARSVIRQYEWHASDANRPDKLTKAYKFNVLLTTYEMILADSPHLRGVSWEVLIVDEGHRLKNSESKLFSLLNTFSFQHRVLLTGTPLQNNLGEMYNLLNFLQPSSFPSLSSFEEKFNDLSTAEKVEELKKLVAPHMLRRLKKDVMKNIPPKTERMVPVELTSIQAEYYRAMLTKNYQILRNNGKGIAQQSMLNIVMQLRKVCNHPYLIPGTEPESGSVEFLQEMRIRASAKLTLLHSMLKILHKEGHRVLIFSQMTKLLDVLEDYLAVEFGLGTFERVDGSVSVADRQATIARFNRDKTRFVFLLSTRSCGLGINLATADTVIIYDSDFNPHADIQAMNRAHRIGQSNRLLVYRLVVRASVEERILQLAKKKLMLDQLFVNKSDSQKEVEDILRWGTEELFSDSDGVSGQDIKTDSINKCDATADGEYKHRRRVGGLGNVYKDRCTDGGTRVTWDENAILKLLDRSTLQSGFSENTDGDMENDMLGSVKSLDWTEESLNEEPHGSELLANPADSCDASSEAKEDNTNAVTEENEWDRLLRVRWEKSQLEEEAALGRGKRMRKAVSYKETFAAITSEALNESGNEEEEPEREYTPAGRALKEKFEKLRSRQKERIAQRHITDVHSSVGRPFVEDLHNRGLNTKHSADESELNLSINLEESTCSLPFDSRCIDNSMLKNGRASKHVYKRYRSRHFDLSVNTPGNLSTDIIPPSNHLQKTSLATSVPSSSLLPVLGLCAPNASQRNRASRTSRTTVSKQASCCEQRTTPIVLADFLPASAAVSGGLLSEANVSGGEALTDPSTLPDTPGVTSHLPLKNMIPDKYFPFEHSPPEPSGRVLSDLDGSLGASFSSFHEKLGLPKLILDDKLPVKFALPPRSSQKLQADFLSSLSLSANMELANGYSLDPSNVPLVPKFKQEPGDMLKQKQQLPELPPMLGLGTVQTPHSLPDNHKKVLDSIMMRTRTAAHKFWNKRLKLKAWSEDELDALWIGVRRHGRGNWDAMLRDHRLKALKHRSIEELSSRWNEEQHKIIDGPAPFPENSKFLSNKFAAIVAEPPKFHSHLTDIRLACADLLPKFPSLDQFSHLGAVSEVFPPLPSGQADNSRSYYFEDMSAGMRKRLEKISLPLDQSFHFNSFSGSDFGGLGMSSRHNCSLPLNEDVFAAGQTMKSPSSPDKSSNLLNGTQNILSGISSSRLGFDAKKKHVLSNSTADYDSIPGSSKVNKLPHWLREAVSAPSKPPEPLLPKSVSAIAQSVRVLYGEDKSTIPPFAIPEPLPLQPKYPRKSLRKRRKLDSLRQAIPDVSCSEWRTGISASGSIPTEPPMAACSIPPAPPFMVCSFSSVPPIMPSPILAPPLVPSSIHSLPQLVKSSTHLTPPGIPSSIPTAPPLMQSSISTVQRTLAPCSFTPAPPLTAHLSCLPRKETGSKLSSLNLNLSSASSSHGDLWSPVMSFPSPVVLPLVDPYTAHARTTQAVPNEISELAALKDPESSLGAGEGLMGDFQGFHMKHKDTRNSSLGCGGKLNSEHVEGIESGDSSNTMSGSRRDNGLHETSSQETVLEQKSEQGS